MLILVLLHVLLFWSLFWFQNHIQLTIQKGVDTLICFQLLSRLLIFILFLVEQYHQPNLRVDHETKSNMDVSYVEEIIPFFGTFFSKKPLVFPTPKINDNNTGPSVTVRMNSRPGEVLNLGHNQLEYRGLEILVEVQNAEDGWVLYGFVTMGTFRYINIAYFCLNSLEFSILGKYTCTILVYTFAYAYTVILRGDSGRGFVNQFY